MKKKPQAGEIWKWTLFNSPAYVLLVEPLTPVTWKGIDLDDGVISEWFFNSADMKHWEYVA